MSAVFFTFIAGYGTMAVQKLLKSIEILTDVESNIKEHVCGPRSTCMHEKSSSDRKS